MESTSAWGPCGFQLANCSHEERAAEVWAPAGFPVEYASTNLFGTCSVQATVPESSGGQQLVEHYYYSAASRLEENSGKQLVVDDSQNGKETKVVSEDTCAREVFHQVGEEFKVDIISLRKKKMHRYPASLATLSESYTVPRIVAIGPYHHHRPHLKQTEKVKHAAAIQCTTQSGCLVEEVYNKFASAADRVRCLYDKNVMADISYDDFRHMMFFDACFLVQYMLLWSDKNPDESLRGFLGPNSRDIRHDIVLLENQIPWELVKMVPMFKHVSLERFVLPADYLQHHRAPKEDAAPDDKSKSKLLDYKPPHLLGLLRHHTVGITDDEDDDNNEAGKPKNKSISISAMELAEIGIMLTANKTMELTDMGLEVGPLLSKLYLAPLSLDRNRASYLVNMAALELCTVKSFSHARVESSAVCSYLLLLAMLVYRAEDVQKLRETGVLQGGGGLTNEEALSFFTSLQGLRFGRCYNRVMEDIARYKENRPRRTKLHAFLYKNWKIITAVVGAIGGLGGIIGDTPVDQGRPLIKET